MLADLIELTDGTSDQIRRLAHDLRPCALDRYPLEIVLEEVCREFARRTGLEIEFDGASLELPESARISFYRFLQETLTNAARHAGAARIVVRLSEWDGLAVLSVTDDGFGFAEVQEGVGLTGLRERFDLLGGWIEIDSIPGKGTCVQAGVPTTQEACK
jgi:two-component system sensor histidine kinase UhpB